MEENKNKNGNYKLSTEHRLTKVEGKVDTIIDNHLPHILTKVDKVNSKVDKLLWIVITTLIAVILNLASRFI